MGRTWHTVASSGELPGDGSGLCVELDGRRIALFAVDGAPRAIDDVCPHEGASLSLGVTLEGEVTCPWHGWHFELEGGRNTDGLDEAVEVYPCRVRSDGRIEVGLPDADRSTPGAGVV